MKQERWYGNETESYFVKSRTFPNPEWTIHIWSPLEQINRRARWTAVGAVVLPALAIMYINQIRVRMRERKESQRVLRQAYVSPENKHSELQALTEELRVQSALYEAKNNGHNRVVVA